MADTLKDLQYKVNSQKDLIPSLYGEVDFSIVPERFTKDPSVKSTLPARLAKKHRRDILSNEEKVARAQAYTMLGDTVADAYAALMPEYGFRNLISMLRKACDQGLDAVDHPPKELTNFIHAMECTPEWLDMELVEKGARYSRIHMANLVPFAIRGAFIATFMNKYSGLPMALTGALSTNASVQRVNETASFFTTASLPGALQRYGVGFKAAAMVRLMHSMVRFSLLTRSKNWDTKTYGIPIPQVDQMPAGTIPAFLSAFNVIRTKRKHFNERERAIVELCRYQCFLLGLPEELLPETPQDIVDVMLTYTSTLKEGYDDATCGELVRATMSGYRPKNRSLSSRIYNQCEKSFATVFFEKVFLSEGNEDMAERMGVKADWFDYCLFALVQAYVIPKMIAHRIALKIPIIDQVADNLLIKKINRLLVEYGHPEYTTNPDKYKVHHSGSQLLNQTSER